MRQRALVAGVLLIATSSAYASSASAPLLVSLTVVRSCAVQTGTDVTLRCSTSAGHPRIDATRTSDIAPAAPAPATSAAQPSSNTRLITINF